MISFTYVTIFQNYFTLVIFHICPPEQMHMYQDPPSAKRPRLSTRSQPEKPCSINVIQCEYNWILYNIINRYKHMYVYLKIDKKCYIKVYFENIIYDLSYCRDVNIIRYKTILYICEISCPMYFIHLLELLLILMSHQNIEWVIDDIDILDVFTRSSNIWLVHACASTTRSLIIYYCHPFIYMICHYYPQPFHFIHMNVY